MARYYVGSRGANPSPTVTILQVLQGGNPRRHILRQISKPPQMTQVWVLFPEHQMVHVKSWLLSRPLGQTHWLLSIDRFLSRPHRGLRTHTLTSFKTLVERVTKLNPKYMVPVNEVSLVISDPQKCKSVGSSTERTANKRSTTKRIEIQPHLHRARFNIHPEYKGSSSIIPQTASTVLVTCQENTTSKLTWQSCQFNMEDVKSLLSTKMKSEKELGEMVWQGIIAKQTEPTPWVSSLTYPKKTNGKLRICLDPKDLNKAIIRENHKAPTLEEITHMSSQELPNSPKLMATRLSSVCTLQKMHHY